MRARAEDLGFRVQVLAHPAPCLRAPSASVHASMRADHREWGDGVNAETRWFMS